MSSQNKPIELDDTRPDRLAPAMLITGMVIVCQVVLYRVISYIVGIWAQPYVLPLIILGGIGMVYGSFRTVRGSSATKQFLRATLIKVRSGAIAGSAMAFVVLQIAQVSANHDSWHNWLNGVIPSLIIDIPGALFLGISAGGIGGLMLGNMWKNNQAAIVGGASAGLLTSLLFVLSYFRGL